MADQPEKSGGEGEGPSSRNPDHLRRSELATLRQMASRFPFTAEDRIKAVGRVNDIVADDEAGHRAQIAAVRTMAELDRLSLAEVALLLQAEKNRSEQLRPPGQTNVTIINVLGRPAAEIESLVESGHPIEPDHLGHLPAADRLRILRKAVRLCPERRQPEGGEGPLS